MDKFDASYFLGPEYQRDSSLMHHLADLLVLAQGEGLLDVVDTELFLIIAEYIKPIPPRPVRLPRARALCYN